MSMNTALPEEADGFMRGVFVPPQAIVGRYCCAQSTNPDNYRSLVGDVKKGNPPMEELTSRPFLRFKNPRLSSSG